jgi:uncharacterized protein (TIGR00251 family)
MPELDIRQDGEDVLIGIKAVPGASRDQLAGAIGERLKVRISAPPEDGKANKAICRLIAAALRVKGRDVTIESGRSSREKTVRIAGVVVADVAGCLPD